MDYLLTLQFPFSGEKDFDRLIDLEDSLEEVLADSADVDGHDAGSDEMNIFIFTDDPKGTFWIAKGSIENAGLLKYLSAAYRKSDGKAYTRLWPTNSNEPFIVK